ncbi:UNVERIFIED_ORG: hypothetical protein J2791_006748 [Burkholderia contaminans]|nr:hypothetical protein [Burkholderia contaminans]
MTRDRIAHIAPRAPLFTDLEPAEVERLNRLLVVLRASLVLSQTGDVGHLTSDLKAAFFGHLADLATSAHAIAAHMLDDAARISD